VDESDEDWKKFQQQITFKAEGILGNSRNNEK